MATLVNLDPDIEALLLREVRERNVALDLVVNEKLRAALPSANTERPRFLQTTYSMGAEKVDLTKALSLADELEDIELIKRMHKAEGR